MSLTGYETQGKSELHRLEQQKKLREFGHVAVSVLRGVFIFCLSIIILYPIFIMLSLSLRDSREIFDPTVVWIPKTFTLKNFAGVLEKLDFLEIMLTTAMISVVSSLLQLISCALAGYGFSRFRFKLNAPLQAALIFSIIVPSQLIMIPSYVDFSFFDFFGIGSLIGLFTGQAVTVSLIDTLWVYFLPAALASGIRGSLYVFIFIQFFKGLPKELEEAAYMDGCGRFRTFFRVMLPNARAAVVTVSLFSVVWYWNDYYYNSAYFSDLPVVSRALTNINTMLNAGGSTGNPYDTVVQTMAAGVLCILVPLIVYIIFQRQFTESIDRVGIVG